jgi:glycosyltransferase 2 family protein
MSLMADSIIAEPRPVENSSPEAPTWSRWIGRGSLILGIIMCLYVGVAFWAARGDLVRLAKGLPWQVVPTVIALVLTGLGLRSLRWHYYVRHLRWPVPLRHSLVAFLASFAFSATPGKAGEMVKCVLLRTHYKVRLTEGAGVLMVERLGDLLAVLILATGGLALVADGLVYFVIAAILVSGMTVFVSNRAIYYFVLSRIARIRKLSRLSDRVIHLLDTSRALLRPFPFLVGVGIAIVAWGFEGVAFHVLIRNFGISIQLMTSCSIYGIATVVGALSALPGGLGSFEVVMVLLLSRLGLPAAAATLPVLLFRFCTLWLGSFVGLCFLLGWLWLVPPGRAKAISGESK